MNWILFRPVRTGPNQAMAAALLSVATIEHYLPTPEDLRWGADHAPTAERLFTAIRVNPMLLYRLYVDLFPELSFFGSGTLRPDARLSTVASRWIALSGASESPAQCQSQ